MTIRTQVILPGEELQEVVRDENVVLEGENSVFLHFACGELVPLWALASHAANFFLSHREYLHDVLGPQDLEADYSDDLLHLLWRAYEIHSEDDRPEIAYNFRRIRAGDEDVFSEEIGVVGAGELQYRWLQGDEEPDVTIELHFVPLEDEDLTAVNAVRQSVMLAACPKIQLPDDKIMPRDDEDEG